MTYSMVFLLGRSILVSTRRRIAAFDDDVLHDARTAAAKRRRVAILLRFEAGDRAIERGKLDHDEAVERLGAFHDAISPAAREDLAAVARDDLGYAVGIPLVLRGIVDLGASDPVGRHDSFCAPPRILRAFALAQRSAVC